MFRVEVDSLEAYLDFDASRKADLVRLHALLREAAPRLKRHFHKGTPPGEPGMRMKMIGYGKYRYAASSGILRVVGCGIFWTVHRERSSSDGSAQPAPDQQRHHAATSSNSV